LHFLEQFVVFSSVSAPLLIFHGVGTFEHFDVKVACSLQIFKSNSGLIKQIYVILLGFQDQRKKETKQNKQFNN